MNRTRTIECPQAERLTFSFRLKNNPGSNPVMSQYKADLIWPSTLQCLQSLFCQVSNLISTNCKVVGFLMKVCVATAVSRLRFKSIDFYCFYNLTTRQKIPCFIFIILCTDLYTYLLFLTIFPYNKTDRPLHCHGKVIVLFLSYFLEL